MTDFTLGINYWPRRKAMYWWKEFDLHEVEEEFSHITSLGFDLVRFFLLWEDFQPKPDVFPAQAFAHLGAVLDVADKLGIRVQPTIFQGNMSGVFWLPEWTLEKEKSERDATVVTAGTTSQRRIRDLCSPEMLAAQQVLVEEVLRRFGDHPAVESWDLANELDELQQLSTDWLSTLVKSAHMFTTKPITYGAHTPSLITATNGLPMHVLGAHLDISSIHAYSVYFPLAVDPLDARTIVFTNLLAESLTRRPILMQEYGLCTTEPGELSGTKQDLFLGQPREQFFASEQDQAQFFTETLKGLWSVGSRGAVLWCYADYSENVWGRPPCDNALRERSFGLIRRDGTPKPALRVVQEFARTLRQQPDTLGLYGAQRDLFQITPEQYYQDPRQWFQKLWEAFCQRYVV